MHATQLRSLANTLKETQHSVTFKTTFFTVPKVEGAEVPPDSFAAYVVPEEVVREAAESADMTFDFSSFWVVDESCPRELLGLGVSRIELSLASITSTQHAKHSCRKLTRIVSGARYLSPARLALATAT